MTVNSDKKIKLPYSPLSVENLLAVTMIWSAGGAITYQSYYNSLNNIISIIIILPSCFFVIHKHLNKFNIKPVVILCLFLLVWGTLGSILKGGGRQYYYLIFAIISSLALYLSYGQSLFYKYEKVVANFALISLILYTLCLTIPSFIEILNSLSFIPPKSGGTLESSIGIFGVSRPAPEETFLFSRRNLGFAWEPGRFSAIIIIALFFNLIRTKFTIVKNKNFWWLFITLVTTQSTTGLSCLVLILLAYSYNTEYKFLVLSIGIILMIISFTSLSFMGDKIIDLWNWQNNMSSDYENQIFYLAKNEKVYVPQRFEGIFYDWHNFKNDILFGYGQFYQNSYVNRNLFIGASIYCSDGIVQVFAQCGIVVGSFMYYSLYNTSKLMSSLFKYRGILLFGALFVLVNISYNFWTVPIFIAFIFFGFYEDCKYCNRNV